MYNGIGILTPRGTGTSGHVQANKFNVRRAPVPKFQDKSAPAGIPAADKKPNQAILEHNRKRQIEVKLLEYQDELEASGMPEDEVEAAVAAKRAELTAALEAEKQAADDKLSNETHATAQRKQEQMEKLRQAFGLKDVVWGEAFDAEAQAKKKAERIEERKAQEKEAYERRESARKAKVEREERRQQQQQLREEEARAAADHSKAPRSGSRDYNAPAARGERDDGPTDRRPGYSDKYRSSSRDRGRCAELQSGYESGDWRRQDGYYRRSDAPPDRYNPEDEAAHDDRRQSGSHSKHQDTSQSHGRGAANGTGTGSRGRRDDASSGSGGSSSTSGSSGSSSDSGSSSHSSGSSEDSEGSGKHGRGHTALKRPRDDPATVGAERPAKRQEQHHTQPRDSRDRPAHVDSRSQPESPGVHDDRDTRRHQREVHDAGAAEGGGGRGSGRDRDSGRDRPSYDRLRQVDQPRSPSRNGPGRHDNRPSDRYTDRYRGDDRDRGDRGRRERSQSPRAEQQARDARRRPDTGRPRSPVPTSRREADASGDRDRGTRQPAGREVERGHRRSPPLDGRRDERHEKHQPSRPPASGGRGDEDRDRSRDGGAADQRRHGGNPAQHRRSKRSPSPSSSSSSGSSGSSGSSSSSDTSSSSGRSASPDSRGRDRGGRPGHRR